MVCFLSDHYAVLTAVSRLPQVSQRGPPSCQDPEPKRHHVDNPDFAELRRGCFPASEQRTGVSLLLVHTNSP